MVFGYDVPVKFTVEGACATASVHLTGYFQPGPDDDNEDDDEDDEDGEYAFSFYQTTVTQILQILIILSNF
jgi:hypothetical protein